VLDILTTVGNNAQTGYLGVDDAVVKVVIVYQWNRIIQGKKGDSIYEVKR
jgi:hypothetical protein